MPEPNKSVLGTSKLQCSASDALKLIAVESAGRELMLVSALWNLNKTNKLRDKERLEARQAILSRMASLLEVVRLSLPDLARVASTNAALLKPTVSNAMRENAAKELPFSEHASFLPVDVRQQMTLFADEKMISDDPAAWAAEAARAAEALAAQQAALEAAAAAEAAAAQAAARAVSSNGIPSTSEAESAASQTGVADVVAGTLGAIASAAGGSGGDGGFTAAGAIIGGAVGGGAGAAIGAMVGAAVGHIYHMLTSEHSDSKSPNENEH